MYGYCQQIFTAFPKNRIIKKLFLKIGTISLSPLKQTVFIEDFFTVVQQSLSAPELEIRVSAAESFAKILRSISSKQSAQILKHFMHYALDMQELPLKGPQELHGIIYALAEIIRQGIYQVAYELVEFFEQISSFWRHCLFFEARQTVVAPTQSALVRDTACYLAWAIAKFTRKQWKIQQLSNQIIIDLVCIALFDGEVNCRRASAACLQQWIGRCDFAKGVELIQVINFNSISQGKIAFTELAKRISIEFPCLRVCLINHLLYVKRFHKGEDTRCLAAETFAFLFSNSPDKQEIAAVLQSDIRRHDPIVFHGSMYFYSSILNQLDDAEIILIDPSVPFISCSPYYALLMDSVLNYVVKLCETKKLDDNQLSSFLDVIFSVCQSKNAGNSSRPLWRKATFECLQLIVQKFTCDFGSIIEKYWQLFIETFHYPYFYIVASAGEIYPPQQKFLLEIYKKSQVDLKIEILYAIKRSTSSVNPHLHDLIAIAIEDYTVDHRGDIGSFVRMEALEIVFLLAKNEFYYEDLFAKIFRICLEKMQKLHGVAWKIVLLYPQFQQIKHYFLILPDDSFDNFSVDFHSVLRVILEESGDISKEALIGFLRAFTSNILYIQEPIYRIIFDLFHQNSFFSLNKLIDKVVVLPGMLLVKFVFLEYLLDKFSLFIQPDTIKQLLQESSIPPDNFKLNSILINIYFLLGSIEPIEQMTLSSIPTLSNTAKQYLKLLSNQPYSD